MGKEQAVLAERGEGRRSREWVREPAAELRVVVLAHAARGAVGRDDDHVVGIPAAVRELCAGVGSEPADGHGAVAVRGRAVA